MKKIELNKIFNIKHGTKLDFNKMITSNTSSINFVSRTRENIGVICKVDKISNIETIPSGTITVSLGGSYLLSAFVQLEEYYTAQNIKVLTPINPMSFEVKAYYCMCIANNRFRYVSHGREANRTLDYILVPDISEIPDWVYTTKIEHPSSKPLLDNTKIKLDTSNWKYFNYNNIFDIAGSKTTPKIILESYGDGTRPYVTTQAINNGVENFYNFYTEEGNVLTVDSAVLGFCSYQEKPFAASDHVEKLIPKFNLNKYIAMFLTTIINKEQYRYNYGRKCSQVKLKRSKIKLPVDNKGEPDWQFMENYIKSLPYSSSI